MNIVFDFGGVVFNGSHAIQQGAKRSGLAESDIRRLFEKIPQALTPIQETIEHLL